MLSTHQKSFRSQGHHQTMYVLQQGAWESQSNIQHLVQGARQHCQPARQKDIKVCAFLDNFKEVKKICYNNKKSNISIIRDENLPSGVGIPSVLVIVHNSDRFGEEYVKDFQASERKGLQALSASVGSYQTVARNDRIVLQTLQLSTITHQH